MKHLKREANITFKCPDGRNQWSVQLPQKLLLIQIHRNLDTIEIIIELDTTKINFGDEQKGLTMSTT